MWGPHLLLAAEVGEHAWGRGEVGGAGAGRGGGA